jgi:hypothetical protein
MVGNFDKQGQLWRVYQFVTGIDTEFAWDLVLERLATNPFLIAKAELEPIHCQWELSQNMIIHLTWHENRS